MIIPAMYAGMIVVNMTFVLLCEFFIICVCISVKNVYVAPIMSVIPTSRKSGPDAAMSLGRMRGGCCI